METAVAINNPSSRDELRVPAWRATSLSAIVLCLLCGAYIQNEVLLGSDVGWFIRSIRLMFDGQRFGVEIFEPNLPVAWYLCMPAAWLVEYCGLTEVSAIRLWVWIIAAFSLLLAHACIIRSTYRGWQLLAELSAAAVAACVLVGPSFGQREHLALLLSLPYLFVLRLWYIGVPAESGYAIAAGVLAGLAFSIKPYFLMIPIAVEFSMFVFWRQHWKLIRPETIAIVIAGSISVIGSLALAPDYLKHVVPVVHATYWAYDNPLRQLLADYPVTVGVFLAWLAALLSDIRGARSSMIWIAVFSAWTASYFLQRKGFDYHGYPVLTCAFVLSIGLLASLAGKLRRIWRARSPQERVSWERLSLMGAVAMLLVASPTLASDTRIWFRGSQENWQFSRSTFRKEVIDYLASAAVIRGKSVFVFSTNPSPAFPTLNYLGAEWVGPDMCQFLLPAWLRKNEARDDQHRQAIDKAMTIQRQHVRQALLEGQPDVILVNRGSRSGSPQGTGSTRVDYFAIFGADPVVAAVLDRYSKVGEIRSVQVYVRNYRSDDAQRVPD